MNKEPKVGWGSTRITYSIMTDHDGVEWKVPTHIDGKPVEYLEKYDPKQQTGTIREQFMPLE